MNLFYRKEEDEKAVGAVYCEKMDELLQKSDFVMVVVNLSPDTQKLIGWRELSMMKPSGTLINISRGIMATRVMKLQHYCVTLSIEMTAIYCPVYLQEVTSYQKTVPLY